MQENHSATGAPSQSPLGELIALPRPIAGAEGGGLKQIKQHILNYFSKFYVKLGMSNGASYCSGKREIPEIFKQ